MLKRISTHFLGALILAGVSLGSQLGHAAPFDGLVFHVHQCTTADPCDFSAGAGPPPPGYLDDFTPQAFTSFYEGLGYHPTKDFTVSITGANSERYVYGNVVDGGIGSFETQFVFHDGQVLCCFLDFPYRIRSMNDDGMFVGTDESGPWISSTYFMRAFSTEEFYPTLDTASIQLLDTLCSIPLDPGILGYEIFEGDAIFTFIDDRNDILATYGSEQFELMPISEPSSALLLITSLFCWFGIYVCLSVLV